MRSSRRLTAQSILLLLILVSSACARRTPPVVTAPSSISVHLDAVPTLRAELDQLFTTPGQDRTLWAILIQSLETGETLYRLNSSKLMMPASNMKIVTLSAAAERLGWDYRFDTSVMTSGRVDQDGVLHGDLVVRGTGDPSINGRSGSSTRVFEDWAEQLWQAGIRRIDGSIVGDDNAFDDEPLGAGWAWDYLGYGYAAPIGALQYNEDVVEVAIRAGAGAGDPVRLELRSADSGLELVNRLVTAAEGSAVTVDLRRLPGTDRLEVAGSVPAGTPEFTETASVDNPTEFFARAFRSALIARGIAVGGSAVDIDRLPDVPDLSTARVLVSHQSPSLSELATVLMKVSQNLYADTLLKTLGRRDGVGTAEGGRKVVREVLGSWGISADDLVMYDGSGLSRYNYVTADTLVRILRQMYSDPRHREPFMATLPIAAQDGSLAGRLKGTAAEGNVRAKTGSISNVRSLTGFVRTADGEMLAFSILANHFNAPQSSIDALTDRAVERLANFTRK